MVVEFDEQLKMLSFEESSSNLNLTGSLTDIYFYDNQIINDIKQIKLHHVGSLILSL